MASPFWTYFHDKLNWLPIFRPGPVSAIMKGLALVMDDARSDILWLREQWNPATCEQSLIAGYGESRGVPRNRFDTDESYRKRVINAYEWHKLGGKVRGLERIYLENGFDAQVVNLDDSELWAHFRVLIDANNREFDDKLLMFALFLANEYKPARSVLDYIRTRVEIRLDIFRLASTIRQKTVLRQTLRFFPPATPSLWVRANPAVVTATSERQVLLFPHISAPILQIRADPAISTLTSEKCGIFFPATIPVLGKMAGVGQKSWTASRVRLAR